MSARIILPVLALLSAFSLAGAEEIELAYTEANDPPAYYMLAEPEGETEEGWLNAGAVLTGRAKTFTAGGRLAALDYSGADRAQHDILYVDVDRDRTIDPEERFALAQPEDREDLPAYFTNPLAAKKVPCAAANGGDPETHFVNYTFASTEASCIMATSAWGCFVGEGAAGGEQIEVKLQDANANGAFGDLAWEDGMDCDRLTVSFKHSGLVETHPLRKRLILSEGVFEVDVRDNGRRIAFEPIDTALGTVTVPAEHMEVELSSPDWGVVTVHSGRDARLPEGEYTIRSFARTQDENSAWCGYGTPRDACVTIEAGATTAIKLETLLHAELTTRKSRGAIRITARLATSEGAPFRGYSYSDKPGRTVIDGVPFLITDQEGNVVVEDVFAFG